MKRCTVEHKFSQGSAATEFRCGGRFYLTVFRSLSTNPKVKELLKSVHICQSYRKNKSDTFLPRDASAERGYEIACRLSVCLSVRPSVYLRIQKWKNYWNRSTFAKVIVKIKVTRFYRAMLAQSAVMRLHVVCLSVCLSVRLSVTIRYRVQIGWNSSKIISRPNILRPLLWLTPNMGDLVQREHPKIRVE